jgi:hypothetical protein
LIINVAVAEPEPVTCICCGLNEHIGANATAGETEHVRLTMPAKPPDDPSVTTAVAD